MIFQSFVNFFTGVFGIFFMAGVAYMAYLIDVGDDVSIADMLVGFKHHALQQVILFVLSVVLVLPMMILFGSVFFGYVMMEQIPTGMTLILMSLMMMVIMIPLAMALWLAPIVILFHGVSAWQAIQLSFKACLANILPLSVLGVVMMLLGVVAMIPMGLGVLILMPIGLIVSYVVYKETLIG
ncbi:MAG: hypothetical protein Q3971_03760 [Moraxella sp.]|nr:hypothetical protein [Moraxella sp.]